MPAVDYRLGGGGLSFAELSELLKTLVASGRAVGMDITIFNPQLGLGGSITQRFVSSLAQGLS
jgi:arginase